MSRKVFISYKYADEQVADLGITEDIATILGRIPFVRNTRVRDYVDLLQKHIGKDNINMGEKDGESLEEFSDFTIETSLKDKIFHSSLTIVLISKGMVDTGTIEKEQWIPWEISYSLRTIPREFKTSRMNGVLGVVLPDKEGSYDWYYNQDPFCNCVTHYTHKLFKIMSENMFNLKNPQMRSCNGKTIHEGEFSFIKTLIWDEFMKGNDYSTYIEQAISIRNRKDEYNVSINLS